RPSGRPRTLPRGGGGAGCDSQDRRQDRRQDRCDDEPNTKHGACAMSADAQAAAALSKPSLTITRKLAAPPDRCFRAWTDPEALKRWFGPGATEVLLAEADPRVGGRYRVVMRSPSGEEHDVSGE